MTSPITAEQKEAWIEALKSGKYEHGKSKLKLIENGVTKHCCLGVLVDVLGHNIIPTRTDCDDGLGHDSKREFNGIKVGNEEWGYDFFKEIFVSATKDPADYCNLYYLNDAEQTVGYDDQIAWIEKNVVV